MTDTTSLRLPKFFGANKDAASIRILLLKSGLIPYQLTLLLKPKTEADVDRESVPSPQPDDGWQNGNQSLRRNIIVLNPGIHSVEF